MYNPAIYIDCPSIDKSKSTTVPVLTPAVEYTFTEYQLLIYIELL